MLLSNALSPDHACVPDVSFKQDLERLVQEAVLLSKDTTDPYAGIDPEPLAVQNWGRKDPWLPLLLQWQVQYKHLQRADQENYAPGHISDHFQFDEADELTYKQKIPTFDQTEIEPYHGSVLLTPGARFNLVEKLEEELKYNPDFELRELLDKISDRSILSQGLNGFQEHLLMQSKTLQLSVYDPFESFLDPLSTTVKDNIGYQNITAPQPQTAFNPIQDGINHIEQLRLVDAFGRYADLDVSQVIYPSTLSTYEPQAGASSWVKFDTRLNQPARLLFRLLSANHDQQEMNNHPALSPICGWVMHNKVDYSLMFYDTNGQAIGALQPGASESGQTITWQSAPGVYAYGTSLDACFENSNPHLYALAKAAYDNGLDYLETLLATIDKTTACIAPQGSASSIDTAILIGRPLALVQTFLQLELQGLAAVNESWSAFEADINNGSDPLQRSHNDFLQVHFPVRLGDHTHFEDGVVGYFTEKDQAIDYHTFHATIPDPAESGQIVTGDSISLRPCSILEEEKAKGDKSLGQSIGLLVDPRGCISAITGILPVKRITIPEDQYTDALKSIRVTFLSAPLLGDHLPQDHQPDTPVDIPVGIETGKAWSWLTVENEKWTEKSILTGSQQAIFKHPQKAHEGWLKLSLNKK